MLVSLEEKKKQFLIIFLRERKIDARIIGVHRPLDPSPCSDFIKLQRFLQHYSTILIRRG